MDAEFRQYEHLLGELDAFIAESATQGISSDRLRLQLEHARVIRRSVAYYSQSVFSPS